MPQDDGRCVSGAATLAAGSRHFPALDGVRGIAILLVIPHNADAFASTGWQLPLAILAHAGWIGVQLFFVLSGFLITGNLLDSQRANNYFQAFYARRALRIFPLYYGVLVATLVVLPHFVQLAPQTLASQQHQLWLWTFLNNWTEPFGQAVAGFPHFWSLAVEEQFYLVWPFLIYRLDARKVVWLCAGIMVAALLIRCLMLLANASHEAIYMFTFCRMDALAAGAACAALLRTNLSTVIEGQANRLWMIGLVLLAIGAGATDVYEAFSSMTFTIGYSLLSIAFAVMVLAAVVPSRSVAKQLQRMLAWRPLRSVGKYSYAMYVFHMLIILSAGPVILNWLKQRTDAYGPCYTVLVMALTYVAALISYHLYEKHFLKLKGYFVPDRVASREPLDTAQSA